MLVMLSTSTFVGFISNYNFIFHFIIYLCVVILFCQNCKLHVIDKLNLSQSMLSLLLLVTLCYRVTRRRKFGFRNQWTVPAILKSQNFLQ